MSKNAFTAKHELQVTNVHKENMKFLSTPGVKLQPQNSVDPKSKTKNLFGTSCRFYQEPTLPNPKSKYLNKKKETIIVNDNVQKENDHIEKFKPIEKCTKEGKLYKSSKIITKINSNNNSKILKSNPLNEITNKL